jgi:glycosyltransferase involved in cell wall biosynthesis
MRLLFLADGLFEDKPGGSRVVARELARGLARRGHAVTFLVPGHQPDAPEDQRREDGIRVVRYAGAGQGMAFVRAGRAACARLWAEAGGFDLAHTHFAYAAWGPLQALPAGAAHVRSFYGPWDLEGWVEDRARGQNALRARIRRALRRRVERTNLRRSRAVIVLSEHSRGEVAALGYPNGRTHTLPGGVDGARFTPAPDRRAVRAELGLPPQRRLLLSIRRLAPRMGLENLLRAMPRVIERCPDALLVIGGKGPERERLERTIALLGLSDHVRLAGFIPDEALALYYQAADLFVLPTVALEGFGLVTVEALACGTPVLGTPVGATPEILRQLDDRLVTADASPEALAEGILGFFENNWAREAPDLTPERLSRFARERYGWDRHVEGVLALYEAVLAGEAFAGERAGMGVSV